MGSSCGGATFKRGGGSPADTYRRGSSSTVSVAGPSGSVGRLDPLTAEVPHELFADPAPWGLPPLPRARPRRCRRPGAHPHRAGTARRPRHGAGAERAAGSAGPGRVRCAARAARTPRPRRAGRGRTFKWEAAPPPRPEDANHAKWRRAFNFAGALHIMKLLLVLAIAVLFAFIFWIGSNHTFNCSTEVCSPPDMRQGPEIQKVRPEGPIGKR